MKQEKEKTKYNTIAITTGESAVAAAVAGCQFLIRGEQVASVTIYLLNDEEKTIPIKKMQKEEGSIITIVNSDSSLYQTDICVEVTGNSSGNLQIKNGPGIGYITQPGLVNPVGEAAINPEVRSMLIKNLTAYIEAERGITVMISVPKGLELAQKNWYRNLGITGGISLLGKTESTTNLAENTWQQAISMELIEKRQKGCKNLALCLGNYEAEFASKQLKIKNREFIFTDNFWDFTFHELERLAFKKVTIVSQFGKIILHTLESSSDEDEGQELEPLFDFLAKSGVSQEEVTERVTTVGFEETIQWLDGFGCQKLYQPIAETIGKNYQKRYFQSTNLEMYFLSYKQGLLTSIELSRRNPPVMKVS